MWLTPEDPKLEFVSPEELQELREKQERLRELELWLGPRLVNLFEVHRTLPLTRLKKRKP